MANKETLIDILSGGEWKDKLGDVYFWSDIYQAFYWRGKDGVCQVYCFQIPLWKLTKVKKSLYIKPAWKIFKMLEEQGYILNTESNNVIHFYTDGVNVFPTTDIFSASRAQKNKNDLPGWPDCFFEEQENR